MTKVWITILAVCICLTNTNVLAQQAGSDSIATDAEDLSVAEAILSNLDSMTNCLYEGCFQYSDSVFLAERFGFDTTDIPTFSDSEIIEKTPM